MKWRIIEEQRNSARIPFSLNVSANMKASESQEMENVEWNGKWSKKEQWNCARMFPFPQCGTRLVFLVFARLSLNEGMKGKERDLIENDRGTAKQREDSFSHILALGQSLWYSPSVDSWLTSTKTYRNTSVESHASVGLPNALPTHNRLTADFRRPISESTRKLDECSLASLNEIRALWRPEPGPYRGLNANPSVTKK